MSRDNDIRYNGSGYYDETAFKAMKNINRGGTHNMSDNNTTYKIGEIWEMEMMNGITKEVVLLQCFDNYATTLTLTDSEPKQNAMSIKSLSLKYVDCGRLGYCFYDKLTQFVRAVSDDELAKLKENIAKALNLIVTTEAPVALEKQVESDLALKAAVLDNEATQKKCADLEKQLADSKFEITSMSREKDIYKDLYNQLLEKIMQLMP